MTDERAELKPCPFCGGEPRIERRGNARFSTIISCLDCGVTHECGDTGDSVGTGWNRRVADAAPQAPCAKLVITDDDRISETSHQYAPGLPPGEHDVYCVPMSVAPPLPDAARGMTHEQREACAYAADELQGWIDAANRSLSDPHFAAAYEGAEYQKCIEAEKQFIRDNEPRVAILRALAAQEPSQREGE